MSSSFNPNKPLLGRTVLVACSESKSGKLRAGLAELGADTLIFPVIEIRAIEDIHLLDEALGSLQEYSWIIFTSVYGVRFFMERLKNRPATAAAKSMPNICAIGPATARAVNEFGHKVALVPEQYVAEGIVEALGKYSGGLRFLAGHRVLLPRAKEARDVLPSVLAASGIHVDVVPCYENVRAEPSEEAIRHLRTSKPDLLVFTSSSSVRNMIDILGQEDGKRMLLESVVAVLGPITGSTAESFGKRAEIVPKESTIASLIEEICGYYSRNNSIVDRRT